MHLAASNRISEMMRSCVIQLFYTTLVLELSRKFSKGSKMLGCWVSILCFSWLFHHACKTVTATADRPACLQLQKGRGRGNACLSQGSQVLFGLKICQKPPEDFPFPLISHSGPIDTPRCRRSCQGVKSSSEQNKTEYVTASTRLLKICSPRLSEELPSSSLSLWNRVWVLWAGKRWSHGLSMRKGCHNLNLQDKHVNYTRWHGPENLWGNSRIKLATHVSHSYKWPPVLKAAFLKHTLS